MLLLKLIGFIVLVGLFSLICSMWCAKKHKVLHVDYQYNPTTQEVTLTSNIDDKVEQKEENQTKETKEKKKVEKQKTSVNKKKVKVKKKK
jgi:hypothetical protein